MPNMPTHSNDGDDGGGGGGEGDGRNALLAAIQKGAKLKKVDPDDPGEKKRRATIASTASVLQTGGDLMSALKERMNLRRKGISGARKDDADGEAARDADAVPAPPKPSMASKTQSMPSLMPSHADGDDEAPISMKGMASALKAAASNSHLRDGSDDDGDWSD